MGALSVSVTEESVATKWCPQCCETMPESEFHKDASHSDGLKAHCKHCRSLRGARYRNTHQEREHEKHKAWVTSERGRRIKNANTRKRRERREVKDKTNAAQQFRRYCEKHNIVRPSTCSRCGEKPKHGPIVGHHPDYTKPFEVDWLCMRCHSIVHNRTVDPWPSKKGV